MAFSGTPFMFDKPQQPTSDVNKAQPLATESTLRGIRNGLSIMQSDLVSLNHKKIGGPIQSALDDGMVTKKKTGLGNLAGFLKEIAENTREALNRIPFSEETAEDKMESEARTENRDRDLKAHRKTIKGKWNSFLKWGKESWIGKNWKLILAGLFLLFAPLKWIKGIVSGIEAFIEMPIWGKILTALGLIATYILAKKVIGIYIYLH